MKKDLSKLFSRFLDNNKEYQEALKIVKLNGERAWLIGGFVFRNLNNIIHCSTKRQESDIDILISNSPKKFKTIPGWQIRKNRYGNPKFIKGKRSIDLIPLKTVSQIKRLGLKPTINNYLKYVPFNIQSLVFDINKRKLVGKDGLLALRDKSILIKDAEQAKIYSAKKGVSAEYWVNKKIKELNF